MVFSVPSLHKIVDLSPPLNVKWRWKTRKCFLFITFYRFIVALSGILQQLRKHRSLPCTCDLLLSTHHYLPQFWRKRNRENCPMDNIHGLQSPICPKSNSVKVHPTLPTSTGHLPYGAVYIFRQQIWGLRIPLVAILALPFATYNTKSVCHEISPDRIFLNLIQL